MRNRQFKNLTRRFAAFAMVLILLAAVAGSALAMASEAADRFLRDLSALGMDRDDAVRLLNERKDTDHA